MSDPFVRSITFSIAATATSPGIQIIAVETSDGRLQFTIDVLSTSKITGDLRGLFFDFNRDPLLSELKVSGSNITTFDTIDVTNLGNGVTMQNAGAPYDVGVAFGTANLGKDDIKHQTFTLYDPLRALTLDDIADVEFGVRLTSVGSPTGSRTGSAKLVTMATAAPDAHDDTFNVFEDGRAGLGSPATTSLPLSFAVLANDTDADHNTLLITATDMPAHGALTIIDGPDADLLPGDALQYTPTADYAGPDQFRYAISDGHGGTDFAWVFVNITAVADVPDLAYQILQGDAINQIIVRVTASDTDTDGSEFIDRLEFSGLPNGVQVTAIDINPADQPHTLTRDVVLTVPDAEDWNFDFTVTAFAKEKQGGDEQSASVSVPIDYAYNHTAQQLSFNAVDRSIWGENASTSFNASDVQSTEFSFVKGWSDPSGIFTFGVAAGAEPGIAYTIALTDGTVDARFDYSLDVSSRYNQTTDQLVISSGAVLTGGDFSTSAMDGAMKVDAFLHLLLSAGFSYDFSDYIEGLSGFIPLLKVDHTFGLPVVGMTDTNLQSVLGLAGQSAPLPISATDVFGNHYDFSWPASGSNAGPMAADGSLSSAVDGSGFTDVNVDLDGFLTVFAGFPNMVITFDPLAPLFTATIDLLDLHMALGLDFNQNFTLQPQGLDATITFEDGESFDFVFGQDFSIGNAAAIDTAGNADGKVDYAIAIDQQAMFSNLTTMDMDLAFPFDVLKVSGSYDLAGLLTGTFSAGPVYHEPLDIAIPPGTLYDHSFALDFVGQSVVLAA